MIIGKDGRSAVGTLVERVTRYTMLLHLPEGRGAASVDQAMRQATGALPGELFRTITRDQGEPGEHVHRRAAGQRRGLRAGIGSAGHGGQDGGQPARQRGSLHTSFLPSGRWQSHSA